MTDTATATYLVSIEPRGKEATFIYSPTPFTGLANAREQVERIWQERKVAGKATTTIALIDAVRQKMYDVFDGDKWWSQEDKDDGE